MAAATGFSGLRALFLLLLRQLAFLVLTHLLRLCLGAYERGCEVLEGFNGLVWLAQEGLLAKVEHIAFEIDVVHIEEDRDLVGCPDKAQVRVLDEAEEAALFARPWDSGSEVKADQSNLLSRGAEDVAFNGLAVSGEGGDQHGVRAQRVRVVFDVDSDSILAVFSFERIDDEFSQLGNDVEKLIAWFEGSEGTATHLGGDVGCRGGRLVARSLLRQTDFCVERSVADQVLGVHALAHYGAVLGGWDLKTSVVVS